jgi:hypothetical protein
MKPNRCIGVSFLQGRLQIAEVEHGRKMTVTSLAEHDSSMDFSEVGASLSPTHPQLANFVAELKEALHDHKVEGELISFALPPDPVFINIIPIDTSLGAKELQEHLRWEVQQYQPDVDPKTLVIDSHKLPLESSSAQHSFMVAVRKPMAAFLSKAATMLKRKMHIIDIDQFSTEKTLTTNYPEILEHDIILFGLRFGGIDASLIHNGQMTDYRSYQYDSTADPKKPIEQYLKYVRERYEANHPAGVLLHGVGVNHEMIVSLRQQTGMKQLVALNALRKIKASSRIYEPYVKESHRFAAAIGLALRAK